ncbi:hypothetical protein AArcSt11_02675 [Natranaeroarchaeum aerophilus]|uniref:Uncharacterized protein n=1 Tax=Natranaeroarchaeum aerophilus TaxID=2917711 RepID=A0AAE3FP70_9EURY|nr:hypothetical protein [Natranaeroarchaeum aerophilus]MCL9812556.1 hypothetical protein [Natranaeroarchaeum aerophilus]
MHRRTNLVAIGTAGTTALAGCTNDTTGDPDCWIETDDVSEVVSDGWENVGHQKRGLPLSVLGDLGRETDTAVCFDVGHAYMEDGMDGGSTILFAMTTTARAQRSTGTR